MNHIPFHQRILGGLYGSLVGDALGVPVEFSSRATRIADPVVGMRAHGMHNQPAGTWSDDGSLLLCSVESLLSGSFDPQDMGERFEQWFDNGHWAAHGKVFDIGNTTSNALHRIAQGTPAVEAGGTGLYDNGNGSLMRILPVVLATLEAPTEQFCNQIESASAITHGHFRSKSSCVFFGLFVRAVLQLNDPLKALSQAQSEFTSRYHDADFLPYQKLLSPDMPNWKIDYVSSGGYAMETLTASLWCLLTTSNFRDCVLKAVNLGGDTDTTGCVAGGLAGLVYGIHSIQQDWLDSLPRAAELHELTTQFVATIPSPLHET